MEPTLRARVRAGDPDAYGELFDRHARNVYNFAFRLTGDWSTAEEVVSLTFLEAWRRREAVQPLGESLQPWLLGIAMNTVRNLSRAARRHQAAMSRLPPPIATPDFADELAGRIDDAARVTAARTAMGKLRRPEREVIELCVWSGLDYGAAAEVLGVPVGTVRSRLSRARKRLARLVEAPRLAAATREPRAPSGQEDSSGQDTIQPKEEKSDANQPLPRI